jgi:hypothetical protein
MDRDREYSITCYCEKEIKLLVPETVDLEENREKIEEILQGDFLKTKCPDCGKELKPEFEIQFQSGKSSAPLLFLPEIDRESFYNGKKDVPVDWELVIGYPELREHLLMIQYSLKRFPLEAIKLHLLQKVPADRGVSIYFEKLENEKLFFEVIGLREDEVGIVQVPLKTYRRLETDAEQLMQEEPYTAMLRLPYISVKLVSFEETSE